ncbi:hypothetical protein ACFLZT_04330 [Thermodesulfobacteriota bacterium]
MNLWTAAVVIVAIAALTKIIRSRNRYQSNRSEEVIDDISKRVSGLENRMANIETIVLDKEKEKKFADL